MPSAKDLAEQLATLPPRRAGSDAERRAAVWLCGVLGGAGTSDGGLPDDRRAAELEPFWCRPNWALAQAWHLGLGVAGSLVAVASAQAGTTIVLVALLSLLADWSFGVSPGRRLTFERASQNVVSSPPASASHPRVRLIVTANLDVGPGGLVYRALPRRLAARAQARLGGRGPGWLGWSALALVAVLAAALLRLEDDRGLATALLQLIGTVGLVIVVAALLELAGAPSGPGAIDNASGVATAVALVRALDAAPPAHAGVSLVLTGAGDAQGIGLRRHLHARRREYGATNTIVLGIGPAGAGVPRWLRSDGPLLPLACFGELARLCREVAAEDPSLRLAAARGRGVSPSLPARRRGLPAITLTCLDAAGQVPYSHRPSDTYDRLRPDALDGLLRAALQLVDAIDEHLAG